MSEVALCRRHHCKNPAQVLSEQCSKYPNSKPFFCTSRCACLFGLKLADDKRLQETGQRFTEQDKQDVLNNLADALTLTFYALRHCINETEATNDLET